VVRRCARGRERRDTHDEDRRSAHIQVKNNSVLSARGRTAQSLGRLAGQVSRRLRIGAGESVVGKVATAVDPSLLATLACNLRDGSVMILGTNGKTSTTAMIARATTFAGRKIVTNATGANLVGGVVGALMAGLPAELGVIEADEVVAGRIAAALRPRVMVWTNVFRDQLDRYGEVDLILGYLARAAHGLDDGGTLVADADDPGLVAAAQASGKRVVYFGLTHGRSDAAHIAADSADCPHCGTALRYSATYLGHLGVYECPGCGWRRPDPDVAVTPLELHGARRLRARLSVGDEQAEVTLHMGGLSAASNLGAAAAALHCLGTPLSVVARALDNMPTVFGRGEEITVGGTTGLLTLMKNPAGGNELLAELLEDGYRRVFVAVNDKYADGLDVSWLWDIDFERLARHVDQLVATGRRAYDVAVRLKYAGLNVAAVEPQLKDAMRLMQAGDGPFAILATYTAMREIRAALRGRVAHLTT
jgi:UDP-N-acetylmuramyl tripeptide synthase